MRAGVGSRLRHLTALVAFAAVAEGAAANALDERIDALVRDGFERPDAALARLEAIERETRPTPVERRALLLGMGSVQALAGRAAEAGATAGRLLALRRDSGDALAAAASNLVRAQVAETAGQLDVAAALAQPALAAFDAGCSAPAGTATSAACDYRSVWRARLILERRARGLGVFVEAIGHASAAQELAEAAGDTFREGWSLSSLAVMKARSGQENEAQHLLAQAQRLANQSGDPILQANVRTDEARLADTRGDREAGLRASEEALAIAQRADLPRLAAQLQVNLSDAYTRMGRPADALRAAEKALPVVRHHRDLRFERVLINNAGLARIGLGRIAEGKQDLARVLDLWQRSGDIASQAETLREFGEALARAGDVRAALELYHRERALYARAMNTNRSVALKELQTRHDAEAGQRNIELLARDNALKTEALANRDLVQRIWMLVGAMMLLSIVLAVLLYRRMCQANRRLIDSQARLRVQSESDPLTNLANRRHFQGVMALHDADQGFNGAMLLVDIDHFKRVNDVHGHAVGDRVLVEVARRLNQAVRTNDLVVRWGGEEFLILTLKAGGGDSVEQIAERVLRSVGESPVEVDGTAIGVTVSIGCARFPLPPYEVAVPWEQALNLTDLALYTAKSRGRNRALAIVSSTASDAEALGKVEINFDRAAHEGRITLVQTAGPSADAAEQTATMRA